MKKRFIVVYCPIECKIVQMGEVEKRSLLHVKDPLEIEYEELAAYRKKDENGIFAWNNKFWGIVEAKNIQDALSQFLQLLK